MLGIDPPVLTAFWFFVGGIGVAIYGIAQWDRLSAARKWTSVEGEIYAGGRGDRRGDL